MSVCAFEVKRLQGTVNNVVYHQEGTNCDSCACELLNDTFDYAVILQLL